MGGARLGPGSACQAADIAWREAYVAGRDPTYESAVAFMKNWPGVKNGNPCAVSGVDYVNAIKDLARQGKTLKDPACLEATKSFMAAIPNKPDPANAAAFTAFMDKIFEGGAAPFDPVCLASLEGFIDSRHAGDDLLTANLKSARAFFKAFNSGSSIPADSPCAAATLAYAKEIQKKPSLPNAAAMIAYITEAITKGKRKIDPVCAAATST